MVFCRVIALALAAWVMAAGRIDPPPTGTATAMPAGSTDPAAAAAAGEPTPAPTARLAEPLPEAGGALEYLDEALLLARVGACSPAGELPERLSAQAIEAHCKTLTTLHDQWTKKWLSRAQPFFESVVPPDLPTRVVYPFGGGDLLTALVAFPKAVEITTLSLEPAGDPRAIDTLTQADLVPALAEIRAKVNHIFSIGHSKTVDMRGMTKSKLPSEIMYTLVALTLNDFEVVSMKFFRVGPDGEPIYLTRGELESAGGEGRKSPFGNMEILFRPRGGGPTRVFRHIAANLDDTHMGADPSVLRHLEAKGRIAAMTKAASYLLWWKEFGKIRGYLLSNMVWMISDSTGIPPDEARAAGFEQIPFGRFQGPFLGGGNRPTEAFRKLFAEEAEPLAFRFGYPDSAGHDHLLITRRAVEK